MTSIFGTVEPLRTLPNSFSASLKAKINADVWCLPQNLYSFPKPHCMSSATGALQTMVFEFVATIEIPSMGLLLRPLFTFNDVMYHRRWWLVRLQRHLIISTVS